MMADAFRLSGSMLPAISMSIDLARDSIRCMKGIMAI